MNSLYLCARSEERVYTLFGQYYHTFIKGEDVAHVSIQSTAFLRGFNSLNAENN